MLEQIGIWEQQTNEGPLAYDAARTYFELGISRTLSQVSRKKEKHLQLIKHWSSKYHWVKRAKAYDIHMHRIEQQEYQTALAKIACTDAEEWARRMKQRREQEWQLSENLLAKARAMLDSSLDDTKWSLRDVGVLVDAAKKLSELATAAHTPSNDTHQPGQLTIRVEYIE